MEEVCGMLASEHDMPLSPINSRSGYLHHTYTKLTSKYSSTDSMEATPSIYTIYYRLYPGPTSY